MAKVRTIASLDRRKLTQRIVDMTGMSRREAENAINAVALGIGTYLQSLIRDIPEETQGMVNMMGFGTWKVKYTRRGRRSAWRDRNGMPQRPATLQLIFSPGARLLEELKKANAPIRAKYQKEYRPARDAYIAKGHRDPIAPWDKRQDRNQPPLRQSVIDEINEIEAQPGGQIPVREIRTIDETAVFMDTRKIMDNLPWNSEEQPAPPANESQAIEIYQDPNNQDAYQLRPGNTSINEKPEDQADRIYEQFCGPNPNDKIKTYNNPEDALRRAIELKANKPVNSAQDAINTERTP